MSRTDKLQDWIQKRQQSWEKDLDAAIKEIQQMYVKDMNRVNLILEYFENLEAINENSSLEELVKA